MQDNSTMRFRKAGAVAALALLLFTFKPAAEALWRHPGVLVVRSQMQLMRGHTQSAVDLAAEAVRAARQCGSMTGMAF